MSWHPLQSGRRLERHGMQSCWDKVCNLGARHVLGGMGTNSWKDSIKSMVWKADLETNEESNGVGQ